MRMAYGSADNHRESQGRRFPDRRVCSCSGLIPLPDPIAAFPKLSRFIVKLFALSLTILPASSPVFAIDRFTTHGTPLEGLPDHWSSSPEAGLAIANAHNSICISASAGCCFHVTNNPSGWVLFSANRERRDWSYRRCQGSTTVISGVVERRCREGFIPSPQSVANGRLGGCVSGQCPGGTERDEHGICIPIESSPGPLPTNSDADTSKQGATCP